VLSAPPGLLAEFKGPTSKGRNGKTGRGEGKTGKGSEKNQSIYLANCATTKMNVNKTM